jgi:hypothetical protein
MPTNPHAARLQRELDDLRSRRVAMRNQLRLGPMGFCGGDDFDKCRALEFVQRQLRATEHRWQELHFLLGIDLPSGPIKLEPVAVRTSTRADGTVKINTPARRTVPDLQAELKRRGFDGRGCLTKDLIPGR